MHLSYHLSQAVAFVTVAGATLVIYLGMRYSAVPASHLSLILIPTSATAALFCRGWLRYTKNQWLGLCITSGFLLIVGGFIYTPAGFSIAPNAIAASLIIVSAYILARALSAVNITYEISAFAFWIVAAPALFMIMTQNGPHFALKNFFEESSENTVTSWLIVTSCAMASSRYFKDRRVIIIPFIVSAIVAFISVTRASIAASIFLLFLMIYKKLGFRGLIAFGLLLAVVVFFFFKNIYELIILGYEGTKFAQAGLDSPRWLMTSSYIKAMTGGSFLFGTDLSYIPVINEYSNNPHSSIIRFHSMFGVIPMLFAILAAGWFIRPSTLFQILLLAVIMVRAATDIILFGLVFDLFLLIIILIMSMTQLAPVRLWLGVDLSESAPPAAGGAYLRA